MAERTIHVPLPVAHNLLSTAEQRAPVHRDVDHTHFTEWHQRTATDLGTIFGDKAKPLRDFEAITYHIGSTYETNQQEYKRHRRDVYQKGILQAVALLRGLLERIRIKQHEEVEAQRQARKASATVDVAAQNKMPLAIIHKVMIASPSDVPDERIAATEVINDWNARNAEQEGIVLIPIKWETNAVPQAGIRPQEAINQQLTDRSDLLIGIFWTKMGTATAVADSGTAEEVERFVKAGKPAMLYFSSRPIDPNHIDMSQFERLKKFKALTYQNALVSSFDSVSDLKGKLRDHLTEKVRSLRQSQSDEKPEAKEKS